MTDTEKTTETAAKEKSTKKSTEKVKPKAAAKPKSKTKPKAKTKPEKKSKQNKVDAAPYLKKASKPEASKTEPPKSKSPAPLVFLLIAGITLPITAYKFNEELSNLSAVPEIQESTVSIENPETEVVQTVTDNNNTVSPLDKTEADTSSEELIKLNRQENEKEMLARKQRYQAVMAARQQERLNAAETQIQKIQRSRQNQQETRIKKQQIREQIHTLHEQIHQLMQEYHTMHRAQ